MDSLTFILKYLCANDLLNPMICRRAQPAIEFVFAATEEAIYVHAVISAKSAFFFIALFNLTLPFH